MKILSVIIIILIVLGSCHPWARSSRCFDEIRDLVTGKKAGEVERLLGKPDSRETLVMSGERWIWWNYTYLDGSHYAPEERGRVVHLEIIFELEELEGLGVQEVRSQAELRVSGPLGVSYSISRETMR